MNAKSIGLKQLFLSQVGQTSFTPMLLCPSYAKGSYIYDDKTAYLDFISGINASYMGHGQPIVLQAVRKQVEAYMHTMVYGEHIQSAQVLYAHALLETLPSSLQTVYFTNSGSEATEGALKLAKRYTGRTKIIAALQAYHGSTQGSLSVMGNESLKTNFRPLLPHIYHYPFGSDFFLSAIDEQTACVILEPIQGEAGIILPSLKWLKQIEKKCRSVGALLIIDENQTGFGRIGTLWAHTHYHIIPDILLLGKGLGGGLPLGAFIAPRKIMQALTHNPSLGHISTFGGNPVCCAAGFATFKLLLSKKYISLVNKKAQYLKDYLAHPLIKEIRYKGLWMAIDLADEKKAKQVVAYCFKHGLIIDWFLFNATSIRLAPPLSISMRELKKGMDILLSALDNMNK